MVIFPLAPDQTIAQMWSNGARGGCLVGISCISWHWQRLTCHSELSINKTTVRSTLYHWQELSLDIFMLPPPPVSLCKFLGIFPTSIPQFFIAECPHNLVSWQLLTVSKPTNILSHWKTATCSARVQRNKAKSLLKYNISTQVSFYTNWFDIALKNPDEPKTEIMNNHWVTTRTQTRWLNSDL